MSKVQAAQNRDEDIRWLLVKRQLDGLVVLLDAAGTSTGTATITFTASGVSPSAALSVGSASISFSVSGHSTAAATIPTTDEYAALWEFSLTSGDEEVARLYKSFIGVRTPDTDYEQGWLSSGMITRTIGPGAEPYSIGQLSTQFHNTGREFSILKDSRRFRGRKQTVRYGRIQGGLAAFRTLFVGAVDSWRIGNSVADFTAKDAGYDRFRKLLRDAIGTVSTTIFPELPPGRPEVLIPLIYGDVSTNGGNMVGAGPLPCYLIDEDFLGKWRYLACGEEMQSIDEVYIYGVPISSMSPAPTYTVNTGTYGGRTMMVIDFDADPRDPTRPNETEITILGKGIVDEFDNLIINPVEQLRHFLFNYAGWDESTEIDNTLWVEASNAALNNYLAGSPAPYAGALFIGGDINQRVLDIVNEFTRSFLLYTYMTADNKVGVFILTLRTAENPPAASLSVDETVILKRSFSCFGNRDVFSAISFQWIYNWTLEQFVRSANGLITAPQLRSFPVEHSARTFPVRYEDRTFPVSFDMEAEGTDPMGDPDTPDAPRRQVALKYVADSNTAVSVATTYSMLASELVQFCEFDLPPEYLLDEGVDLNRYVSVTHWQGISGTGGFSNALFRIVRTETSIEPKNTRIKVTGIRLIA